MDLRVNEFEMQSGVNLVLLVAEFRRIVSGMLVQITELVDHSLPATVERSSQGCQ